MGAPLDFNKLRQIFFLVLLVALGYVLFLQMRTFMPAFLGALTFYMLLRKKNRELVYRRKLQKGTAAMLQITLTFLIILVPIYVFGAMISGKIAYALQNSEELLKQGEQLIHKYESQLDIKIITPQNLQKAGNTITGLLPTVLGATFNSITTIFIMYFILYFMLTNSVEFERWLYRFVPIHNQNIALVGTQMDELVKSNAIGMPVIAIMQAAVAMVAYMVTGVPDPWFWFVITAISAMVPFVGAAMAYLPLGLYMLTQETWKGIAILVWGFLVVGLVDNVFRIWFQKKVGDVHPLITIFGVVVGVQMFGFIGLIFGPIIISLFLLLVSVYTDEFGKMEDAEDYPTEEEVPPSSGEKDGNKAITASEPASKDMQKEDKN